MVSDRMLMAGQAGRCIAAVSRKAKHNKCCLAVRSDNYRSTMGHFGCTPDFVSNPPPFWHHQIQCLYVCKAVRLPLFGADVIALDLVERVAIGSIFPTSARCQPLRGCWCGLGKGCSCLAYCLSLLRTSQGLRGAPLRLLRRNHPPWNVSGPDPLLQTAFRRWRDRTPRPAQRLWWMATTWLFGLASRIGRWRGSAACRAVVVDLESGGRAAAAKADSKPGPGPSQRKVVVVGEECLMKHRLSIG